MTSTNGAAAPETDGYGRPYGAPGSSYQASPAPGSSYGHGSYQAQAPQRMPQAAQASGYPAQGPATDPNTSRTVWPPASAQTPMPRPPAPPRSAQTPMPRPPTSDGNGWPALPPPQWTGQQPPYSGGPPPTAPAPGTGWTDPPSAQGWAPGELTAPTSRHFAPPAAQRYPAAPSQQFPAVTAPTPFAAPPTSQQFPAVTDTQQFPSGAGGGRQQTRQATPWTTSVLRGLLPDPTRPHSLANTVSGGLIVGLLSWIGITLTAQPALSGGSPAWSASEVVNRFVPLIGWLLSGAVAGLILHTLSRRSPRGSSAIAWSDGRAGLLAGQAPGRPATRVVILGGGFGGISAAQHFEKLFPREVDFDVTLVSKSNYLLFTPMLAEVACSSLEAAYISVPVRVACPRTRFRQAEVETVDPERQVVFVRSSGSQDLEAVPYDHLVIALGTVPSYLGLPGVQEHSFTLKTLDDATRLRDHVIDCLEQADTSTDPEFRRRKLSFVVAGAGFSGTEMAAGIFDLAHEALHYYPTLSPEDLRVVLVHSRDRILPEIGADLARAALRKLRKRGIEFVLPARVASATPYVVSLSNGLVIPTETLVWTAGNRPNPLIAKLPLERNSSGALVVDNKLRVRGYDNVWALGDCAQVPDLTNGGKPCPPTAQHALRMGKTVARNVVSAAKGNPLLQFRFRTIGLLVSLGHRSAAAEVRGWKFFGVIAWVMWRSIYLFKLPGAEKRTRVLFDWILDFFFPRDIALLRSGTDRSKGVAEGAAPGPSTDRRRPRQMV